MTNKDKYLKEGVNVEELSQKFYEFCNSTAYLVTKNALTIFFEQPIQPTLTEDERVILKNIDDHTFEDIRRNNSGFLELYDECLNEWISCQFKDHLFQFIQERRRILNRRTFERRINNGLFYAEQYSGLLYV